MAYFTNRIAYIVNQPPLNDPFNQLNNEWATDLCGCCDDMSRCCYAYWCWCCFLSSLTGKLNESRLSCCCVPNALGFYRMKVRSIFQIKGDTCGDYCVTSCCPFCAALQIDNELNYHHIRPIPPDYDINTNFY